MNEASTIPPEIPELFKDWTEEDQRWVKTQHVEMYPTIAKHGRACFMLVMQAGMLSVALGHVMGVQRLVGTKGQQQLGTAAMIIQRVTNDLMLQALAYHELDQAKFESCKEEVERVGTLVAAVRPEGRTPGGLILPH